MASIQDLKKNVHYTLGDIIDFAMTWEDLNGDKDKVASQGIIDQSIAAFDELMTRINAKNVEDKKAHFKAISNDLEAKALDLVAQVNAL